MAKKSRILNWQFYLGVILVVAGGLFLVDQLTGLHLMRTYWPLLIVFLGLAFFVAMLVSRQTGSGLAIPGSLFVMIGLLLFIQQFFQLWSTWAYAWALLISAIGVGLLIMNISAKRVSLRRVAGLLIGIGLVLFLILGFFFEIILKISGPGVEGRVFFSAGVVLLGLFVLFSRPLFAKSHPEGETANVPPVITVDAVPVPDPAPAADAPKNQETD